MWDNVNISNNLNVGGGITANSSTIIGSLGIMHPNQSYYTCSMRTTAAGAISIGCDNIRFVDSNHNQNAGNVTFGGNVNVVGEIYNPNGINLTKNWKETANGSAAEISNDTKDYKCLMIVGNSSNGSARTIGMWDNVNISNNLNVNGTLNVTGGMLSSKAILSTVTNGFINGDSVFNLQPRNASITQLYWECQYFASSPSTAAGICANTWIHTEYIINQNASFHKLISSNNANVSNISTTWIAGMYYPLIGGNNGDKWNVRITHRSIFT
jgi:hypothetical protein